MHPLMQERHDADVSVRQPAPVNEMMDMPKVKPLDPELGRDEKRKHTNNGMLSLVDFESRQQKLNKPVV
jgi:hypothetical protein